MRNCDDRYVSRRRTGQVVVEVLDGALAGDDGLHKEAEHGEHGQAAILDLLHAQLCEAVGVIGQAQGVKGLSGVQGVQTCTNEQYILVVQSCNPHATPEFASHDSTCAQRHDTSGLC